MTTANNTLVRQWHILQKLPKAPRKISSAAICRSLDADGFAVSKRTVERDLILLAGAFPIECDSRDKPYGWSWGRDARPLSIPGLSLHEALTFELVRQHLTPLLPTSTLAHLRPYFDMASRTLESEGGQTATSRWPDKVRAVPASQPLLPPSVADGVQDAVYEALLNDRQIQIAYRKKGSTSTVEYRVHPLAIVQRGQITYLVCSLNDNPDTRLLVLHRIESVAVLDAPVCRLADFDLDEYLDSGALGFGNGETARLEAVFTAKAGEHLYETPLSHDQDIKELPDGRLKITATIRNTPQLKWWLQGFGGDVIWSSIDGGNNAVYL